MIQIQDFIKKLGESILALIKVILLSKFRTSLKHIVKDKDLIILGNGPSLAFSIENGNMFLQDKDLMCVNHFPNTSLYPELKPKYFITVAPDLWLDEIDKKFVDQSDKLFQEMASVTSWPLTFLIPFEAKKYKRWRSNIEKNPNIHIIYYNNIGIEGWKFVRHFFYKKNLAMPRPHNVIIASIYVAINLGYKKIFLWGTEHTQFKEISVDDNNIALINQKHFYDGNSSRPTTLDQKGIGYRKVHEILFKFMIAFKNYFLLEEYSRSRGAKVINDTPGSLIDAFDRSQHNNL